MNNFSMRGLIDLHVHAGPSLAPRSVDAVEMFRQAKEAGLAGFCLKEHYMPTITLASELNRHLRTSADDPFAYGGVVLNNSVGGLNLTAVDVAYCAGATFVCLPTVSAENHLERHKSRFSGAGDMTTPEKPICLLDRNGGLCGEAMEILNFLAAHPDMTLMTGHISAREIDAVVSAAAKLGITRLLVNHPHYEIGATIEDMRRWADQGAYIELNACVFKGISRKTAVPLSVAAEMIEAVPAQQLVLDSDLGQKHNDPPVMALKRFIGFLQEELEITEPYLTQITKTNPAKLLRSVAGSADGV